MRILFLLVCLLLPPCATAIELISHRANSCGAPDNTLEGIESSWSIGVDAIELDVRISIDSIAYLFHDKEIANVPVQGQTYQELISRAEDIQIYTLAEALTLNHRNGYYILDLKDVTVTNLNAVIAAISESQIPEAKLAFQSDDIALLERIHSHYPASRYLYLERLNRRGPFFQKPNPTGIVKSLEGSNIDGISFKGRRFLNEHYLATFIQSGLEIYIWTINDPKRAQYYESLGVSGIITDNISTIRQSVMGSPIAKLGCNQL